MNIFLDTEFYENGKRIYPISFGAVREDGKFIYMINPKVRDERWLAATKKDCFNNGAAETWEFLTTNVFNNLGGDDRNYIEVHEWPSILLKYVGKKPEFWASTCAYDWLLICQLFGRMVDLPEGWPMLCMDTQQIKNLLPQAPVDKTLGVPNLTKIGGEHNALFDAYETRAKYLSYKKYVKENNLELVL